MQIEPINGTANAQYILGGGDTEMTLHSDAAPTAANIIATTPTEREVDWGLRRSTFDATGERRLELNAAHEFVMNGAASAVSVGLWRAGDRTAPIARGEGTVAVDVISGQTVAVPIASEMFLLEMGTAMDFGYHRFGTFMSVGGRDYRDSLCGAGRNSGSLIFSSIESDMLVDVDGVDGSTDRVGWFATQRDDGLWQNNAEETFTNNGPDAYTMTHLYCVIFGSTLTSRFSLAVADQFEIPAGAMVSFPEGAIRFGPMALAAY